MPTNPAVTLINDGLIVATLLIELKSHTGESYVDGLARLFPNLDAGDLQVLADQAQIEEERQFNSGVVDS